MTVFLSSYVNAIDKKGRVSVPASFRGEMISHSRQVVVVYAAPKEGYLYAWGYDDFVQFAERIKQLPPMSKERQRLARTILAAARPVNFDGEGRIMLPDHLLKEAGIEGGGKALFAGQGDYFTIWNPETYESKQEEDWSHYDEDIEALSAGWSNVE